MPSKRRGPRIDKRQRVDLTPGEVRLLNDLVKYKDYMGQLASEEALRTAMQRGLVESIGSDRKTGRPLIRITKKGIAHQKRQAKAGTMLKAKFKTTAKRDLSTELPGEIVRDLGNVYNKCMKLKAEMDQMEEVPNWLKQLYKASMETAQHAADGKKVMYQAERQFRKDWKRLDHYRRWVYSIAICQPMVGTQTGFLLCSAVCYDRRKGDVAGLCGGCRGGRC